VWFGLNRLSVSVVAVAMSKRRKSVFICPFDGFPCDCSVRSRI
jgi:hypothetical protein